MWRYSVLGLLAIAAPATGQAVGKGQAPQHTLPFAVALQLGMGGPSGDKRCTPRAYLLPALELQTRGRWFVSVGAERLQALGPVDGCLLSPTATELPDGRILLNGGDRIDFMSRNKSGGSHFTVGTGLHVPLNNGVAIALRAKVGVARGQNGFESDWVRTLGGSLGIALGRHFVFSLEQRRFRLPQWQGFASAEDGPFYGTERPPVTTTHYSWKNFFGYTLAWRF